MDELMRSIEATLFASAEPLSLEEIAEHVGEGEVEIALGQLSAQYEGRGIELVERGGRWHFQTAPDLAHLLRPPPRSRPACPAPRPKRGRTSHTTSR
jgi:segregation and condensation protein B